MNNLKYNFSQHHLRITDRGTPNTNINYTAFVRDDNADELFLSNYVSYIMLLYSPPSFNGIVVIIMPRTVHKRVTRTSTHAVKGEASALRLLVVLLLRFEQVPRLTVVSPLAYDVTKNKRNIFYFIFIRYITGLVKRIFLDFHMLSTYYSYIVQTNRKLIDGEKNKL